MKKGNEIDKIFKEGLESPDIPFNEADWLSLEDRLHPKPKRRIAPLVWFTAVAGIAAMLLITLFLSKENQTKKNELTDVNKIKQAQKGNVADAANKPKTINKLQLKGHINEYATGSTKKERSDVITFDNNSEDHYKLNSENEERAAANARLLVKYQQNNLPALQAGISLDGPLNQVSFGNQKVYANPAYSKDKTTLNMGINKHKPRILLSILAAPDLTSVQYSGKSSLSGSFGAELTLSLTKRLSITTGLAYAKKIYDSDFSLYKPNSTYVFKAIPSNIHANCDVVDIPLNVNYKVFENNKNSITVSTGLSSYLMLKEKYYYSYDSNYAGNPSYEVKNQNQHYLGIANIGVEFQRKINNKVSIGLRPFVKLPLTDIGYGNSKLSSTGVAVTLNMNLFKK